MKRKTINIIEESGALLTGHFRLTSGNHSNRYIQCASILERPKIVHKLAMDISGIFRAKKIDTVVSPAMGGLIIGYETARTLKTRFLFTEKHDGKMRLRRNQSITAGERVLIVEDVCTTGGSVKKVLSVVKKYKAVPVGIACIVDRTEFKKNFSIPFHPLFKIKSIHYKPEECPFCREGTPITNPHTRLYCTIFKHP